MPTRKKSDEIKTQRTAQKEQHLVDQYIANQTIDEAALIDLGYVVQPYTLADLQTCRDKLKLIAPHITDVQLCHADLIDMTRPVTIAQFLFAGLSWHNWYLDELERTIETQTAQSVFDIREFLVSFNEFSSFFNALNEANIITRTDLTDLAKLTLRCLAFYYFNKALLFDPLLVFKQMLTFGHGVYMCAFLQEELGGDDQETQIAALINSELQKQWYEQQLLMFRANATTMTTTPFAIRSTMYRRSRSISMNKLIKAMEAWMEMRLHANHVQIDDVLEL
jgi:hypothetical protein